jgi:medium-chain acyl-[acyl-carrier-protein] hydrolase
LQDREIFYEEYLIRPYEAFATGKVRLTALLNYMQTTAWQHYLTVEKESGTILPQNNSWVLSKIRLQILSLPDWGKKVLIKTWSPGLDRFFALRNFEIQNHGKIIAKASTAWLIIDTEKKRPVRLDYFKEKWPFLYGDNLLDLTEKIEEINDTEKGEHFKSVYSDIDVNHHVNNVKYVEWMLDHYSVSFLEQNIPKRNKPG